MLQNSTNTTFPCTHSTCPAPLQAIKSHTNRKTRKLLTSHVKKDEKSKKIVVSVGFEPTPSYEEGILSPPP
jgi:hypothetical protein